MSNYNGQFIDEQENSSWNTAFSIIKPGSSVLDVGCSNGNFGKALIDKKRCQVDGIEMAEDDYALASKVLNNTYNCSIEEFVNNKKNKKKYDYIVFLDVIEHLVNPASTLESLKNKLEPDGKVIFSIPNMAHISVRLMLLSGEFDYGKTGLLDNTHLHFYTKKEIERIFGEAGFGYISFDRTEVQYKEPILESELKKVGIDKISNNLKKELLSNSASIFQYVGYASIKDGTGETPRINQSIISREAYNPDPQGVIHRWYEEQITNRDKEIQNMAGVISSQKSIIQDLESKLGKTKKEISIITESKRYKLINKAVNKLNRFKFRNKESKNEEQ